MKHLLQKLRAEMEAHYVPLVLDERDGYRNYSRTGQGCCVQGGCHRVAPRDVTNMMEALDDAARELFPELEGKIAQRRDAVPNGKLARGFDKTGTDHFDYTPAVYINNHLGKEAVLRLIDRAIERVESSEEGV